eukprot:COSAG05_NODE_23661_length_256_cov_0.961783_1_plen_35_part_01
MGNLSQFTMLQTHDGREEEDATERVYSDCARSSAY